MPSETSYHEYFTTVHAIAEEAYALQKEGGSDAAADFIWDSVDGSWWVIYTHAARAVLAHSPNDEALLDVHGSVEVDSFAEFYSQAAFFAMKADVEERLAVLEEEDEDEDEDEEEEEA